MTVTEIARIAGVSIGTVDRVIHNRGRVSLATKERIQEIIKKGGFQPNPLAQHLKRAKPYKIGILMPVLSAVSDYWTQINEGLIKGIEEYAAFGFKMLKFEYEQADSASLENVFQKMISAHCEAWVVAPVMQKEILDLLASSNVNTPFICLDSPLPGSGASVTVSQNPFRGGVLASRLIQLFSNAKGPFASFCLTREPLILLNEFTGSDLLFLQSKGSRM